MSRLADLINELCPDGVEYKPLGEVAELKRGQSITKKSITPGDIPVIAGGRKPAYFTSSANHTGMTIVVAGSGAYAGFVSYWDQPIFVSDAFSVKVNEEILVPRFTYHWMCGKQKELYSLKSGGGVPHVYPKDVAKFKCPIPPLEVQCEIVRILDQFTTLEAELEAELEARQAQYEHYRNHLLSMTALKQRCGEIAMRKLGEVGVFHGGLTGKTKADFVDSPDASAFVTYKEIYSRIEIDSIPVGRVQVADKEKQLALQYGDVLFTGSSENSEEVGMTAVVTSEFSERVYLNSFSICFRWSEELFDPGYAKHMFNSPEIRREIQRCASGVTRFNLSKKRMEKIFVPVPPLEVQHEIMRVLDDFDALVNDIASGLPAEIAARRAQYEHYRDRLLSFPEKKAE